VSSIAGECNEEGVILVRNIDAITVDGLIDDNDGRYHSHLFHPSNPG
jgi:hypothetical protein